jgi:alkanesulfonate monooxygenase SsuD/methylene tetrahydromethanopterin reductase-like flavin-dependent oxidoreductase (luciferase family)
LAKELATLDFLSKGRLLLVVGLGSNKSNDFSAVGVDVSERAQRTDESIRIMRKLWTEESVTFHGRFNSLEKITLLPRPHQAGGPPIWIGGRSKAALKRVGNLGDGWLVSAATSEEVSSGITEINGHASKANNVIEDDHYGVFLPFLFAKSERDALIEISKQPVFRQDIPPESYMALGSPLEIRKRVQSYIDAGASKFVMRPIGPGESWNGQVKLLSEEVIKLVQTPFSKEERVERSV